MSLRGDDRELEDHDEPALLIFGAPLLGVLLVAFGIAGGALGGYAVVQAHFGLCGDPVVNVYTPAATTDLTSGQTAPTLDRLRVSELSDAERTAYERALEDPSGEARVRGPFPHRPAFRRGVLLVEDGQNGQNGQTRYATLVSDRPCLSVNPLFFPLGVTAILVGVGGILAPVFYRRLVAFDERRGVE